MQAPTIELDPGDWYSNKFKGVYWNTLGYPDVCFIPTPIATVREIIKLAKVKPGDKVIDIGCGDGRFLIEAVKAGATGIGLECNPERFKTAKANIEAFGMSQTIMLIPKKFQEIEPVKIDFMFSYLYHGLVTKATKWVAKANDDFRLFSVDFPLCRPTNQKTKYNTCSFHAKLIPPQNCHPLGKVVLSDLGRSVFPYHIKNGKVRSIKLDPEDMPVREPASMACVSLE
jgi:SAM-dependent methyltransferase